MTAAGFRIRKVRLEASIGDKLKRARTRRKISVAQVEEATKIRAKFILALESDSWDQIPSEVYGRGYLEAYAEYLKLPVDALMKQYDRARATYKRHSSEPVELAPTIRHSEMRFLVTPKFFLLGAALAAILVFAGVVGYQVRSFTSAPFLELVTPAQAKTIGTSQLEVYADSFTVNGRTAAGASVDINGKPIVVYSDGSFKEEVPVRKGSVNPIVVKATNPSGNETTETLSVTVK
jgi:cytoskeletal protein RodZ